MADVLRYAGQLVFYVAVMAVIGYLSSRPVYTRVPAEAAQIKLAFSHGANRREPCRRLTPAEIAKLPPNERKPMDCSRERLPIHLQLEIDGELVLDRELHPTGLSKDGPARIYEAFTVPAGSHDLILRLKDSDRAQGFDYVEERSVELLPRDNLAVDFRPDSGGFTIR